MALQGDSTTTQSTGYAINHMRVPKHSCSNEGVDVLALIAVNVGATEGIHLTHCGIVHGLKQGVETAIVTTARTRRTRRSRGVWTSDGGRRRIGLEGNGNAAEERLTFGEGHDE